MSLEEQKDTDKDASSEIIPSSSKNDAPKKKFDVEASDPDYLEKLLGQSDKSLFDPFLTWSICQGFLRDAHTIIECGHTFCKNCICFYSSKRTAAIKCPDCNEDLGGRPLDHVVPDPSIQNIVDILYPEFKQLDVIAVKAMYKAFEDEGGLPADRDIRDEFREIDFSKFKLMDSSDPSNKLS